MFICMSVCLLLRGGQMEIKSHALILITSPPVQGSFWCKFDPLSLPSLSLGAKNPIS